MSDVVINFVGSGEQLQPLLDVLEQLAAKEGAIGEQWKKVVAAMNTGNSSAIQSTGKLSQSVDQVELSEKDVATQAKITASALDTQNKTGVEGSNKLTSSIEGIAAATKKLPESIIGGAYADTLKQLNAQIAQFSTMGVEGSKRIAAEIDKLIVKEGVLKNAIQNSTNPELTAQYELGLKQNTEQINLLAAALDQLQSAGHVFDSFKTSEDEVTEKTKNLSSIFEKTVTDFAKLSDSTNKTEIGTRYTKFLKDIQGQLQLTNSEIVKFLQNSRKNLQVSLANSTDVNEQKVLKDALTQTTAQIELFSQKEIKGGISTQNFTTQLRGLRNQIESIQLAIREGTATEAQVAQLDVLTQKYTNLARVQRQFTIETKGLVANDAVIAGTISLISGIAAGYQVAQGAQAIFGAGSEELQKSLQKLFAIMNLVQGLQQITAVIQKSSAASILLESLFQKKKAEAIVETTIAEEANIAATEGQIIATGEQAVVAGASAVAETGLAAAEVAQGAAAESATVATVGLNAALLDNPITAIIVGVLALAEAVSVLSDNTNAASVFQSRLNDEVGQSGKLADFDLAIQKKRNEIIIANAKNQGASQTELIALQGNLDNQVLDSLKKKSDAANDFYNKETDRINQLNALNIEVDAEILKSWQELQKNKEDADKQYSDLYQQQLLRRKEFEASLEDDLLKSYTGFRNTLVAQTIAGTDAERNAEIKAAKEIAEVRKNSPEFKRLTPGEQALEEANTEKQIQGLQLQNYQHYLKGRTDALDAEIAIAKAHQAISDADQIASINKVTDLQIAALKRQRDESLANPTLNAGERRKIEEESDLAIFEARKKNTIDILNFQKQGISDLLAAANKGSFEEAVYKLELIEIERKAEVAAAGKNVDLINAINAKFFKQREDADRAYDQVKLQNQISFDNAALDRFGLTEQEKLPIVIKRLDEQEQVEILGAEKNVTKIAEIQAKFDKQRLDTRKASIAAELALNIKAFDAVNEIGSRKREAIISDPNSSATAKQIANDELLRNEQFKTDLERDALEKQKLLLSAEDYAIAIQAIKNEEDANNLKHSQTAIQIFKDEQDKKLALLKNAISVIQNGVDQLDTSSIKTGLTEALGLFNSIGDAIAKYQEALQDPNADKALAKKAEIAAIITAGILATEGVINQVFADAAAQRQQELNAHLQALDDQKNKELDNSKLTAQQKSDIEARYAAKERALKQKAWEADKQAKREQAIINGALAVTNALATVAFPFAFIVAGIAAATTALQIAAINKTKAPKFRHGEVDIDISKWHPSVNSNTIAVKGPGTTTSDSIPAWISQGETVTNAEKTVKYKKILTTIHNDTFENHYQKKADVGSKWNEALVAINNDKFENYLTRHIHEFIFPHVPEHIQPNTIQSDNYRIDYEKLSESIAKKMKEIIPAPAQFHNTIDKDGLHQYIIEHGNKTEIKNKRYTMKP